MKFTQKRIEQFLIARNPDTIKKESHAYAIALLMKYHGWNNPIVKHNGTQKAYRDLYYAMLDRCDDLHSVKLIPIKRGETREEKLARRAHNEQVDNERKTKFKIIDSHFDSANGAFCFGTCKYYF